MESMNTQKRKSSGPMWQAQLEAVLARVGRSSRERLEWAIRRVQDRGRVMSLAERSALAEETTVFLGAVAGGLREKRFNALDPVQASTILEALAPILEAAVDHKAHEVGRRRMVLMWQEAMPPGTPPEFQREPGFQLAALDEEDDHRELAVMSFARLLVRHGRALKACAAPLKTSKFDASGAKCGRWFLANRPKQIHCSPTCQRRAATRAHRLGLSKRRR
jgi:hypothetical protein